MNNLSFFSTAHLDKLKQQLIRDDEFEQVIEINRILRERENGAVQKSLYATEIEAVDQADGKLKKYMFVNVAAYSFEEAEQHCREKIPFARVVGKLVAEIPEDTNEETIEYEY